MMDIKADLGKLPALPHGKKYLLTTALEAAPAKLDQLAAFTNTAHNNESGLTLIADASTSMDLMTYDYHGIFDAPATTSGGLSASHSSFSAGAPNGFDVQDSVKDLLKHNVPSHKIVIGLPAYGRIVKLNAAPTSANMGIGQALAPRLTAQGTANQGAGLWNGEFVGDYFT